MPLATLSLVGHKFCTQLLTSFALHWCGLNNGLARFHISSDNDLCPTSGDHNSTVHTFHPGSASTTLLGARTFYTDWLHQKDYV
ncbi:hypothetical protein TNCV_2835071 [Trichonephila clavipes]|nr:hypothetical protein TNCV_5001531 [Trichonephila clavipes]GFV29706.1 hypothetical protein TNCV_2835071 [Trichonephila clavipes]